MTGSGTGLQDGRLAGRVPPSPGIGPLTGGGDGDGSLR